MVALPSFFGRPGGPPPPLSESCSSSHLGMGPYESLPGSNDAQRRRRVWWQRGALLVVGGAVAVMLLVVASDGGGGVRQRRWGGDGDEEGPRLSSATMPTARGESGCTRHDTHTHIILLSSPSF